MSPEPNPPSSSPPPPIACRELVELVTDYLEGALPAAEHASFEAHIARCDHCGAYLEQMRVTLRVAGHIDPDDLDPDVEQSLLAVFKDLDANGG
jgi:anti-sigma factor RsiW